MQFNLDKRFIEILNQQGHAITWDQFRAAYDVRKAERESSPEAAAKAGNWLPRTYRRLRRTAHSWPL